MCYIACSLCVLQYVQYVFHLRDFGDRDLERYLLLLLCLGLRDLDLFLGGDWDFDLLGEWNFALSLWDLDFDLLLLELWEGNVVLCEVGDMEWECWHGFQEHSERNVKHTKSKHTSVYDRITVGSIPRIRSPFLHTTLRQKWGGGVCSNIQSVYTPSLCSSQSLIRVRLTIKMKRLSGRMAALMNVYYRKSVVLVFILGHWSNLHCQWWQGTTPLKFAFQVRATYNLVVARERSYV